MRTAKSLAKELNYDANEIGVWGYSAGGHLAASISVYANERFGRSNIDAIDEWDARPAYSVLVCSVISLREGHGHLGSRYNLLGAQPTVELIDQLSIDEHINESTPPAFLAHSKVDPVVSYLNTQAYHKALTAAGVDSELHLFETGGHGPLGAREGAPILPGSEDDYASLFIEWFHRRTNTVPE